ncbi:hypothetical protein GCM10011508_25050 [Flavobacterium lutivivi]|nr:hypothetical protein GCM10011508_25050 [Flavobacterium lutivivi]
MFPAHDGISVTGLPRYHTTADALLFGPDMHIDILDMPSWHDVLDHPMHSTLVLYGLGA